MSSQESKGLIDATVTRRKFLNCIDIITVEHPELIRRIESSGIVDRPHVQETRNVSFFSRWFLDASKLHVQSKDKWFLGMESVTQGKLETDAGYQKRVEFLNEKLGEGFNAEDVKEMHEVIKGGTDEELFKKGIEIVNRRWLKEGTVIPDSIVKDTETTLKEQSQSFNPFKRFAGVKSTERVAEWVEQSMIPGGHVGDMNHSVHTASQSIAPLLKEYTQRSKKGSLKDFLIEKLPVPTLLRTATQASKLEGILKEPLKEPMIPYRTMVIYDIGKAARSTKDDRFIFGAGIDARQCVFAKFFYDFVESLDKQS